MLQYLFPRRFGSFTLKSPPQWFMTAVGGEMSSAGLSVSADTAMMYSAVYCAVRIIAESVGSLPCKIYERTDDGGKALARDHPMWKIVHDRPNPWMSAQGFLEAQTAHVTTQGNAYAEIRQTNRSKTALWPLNPEYVQVGLTRDKSDILYRVKRHADEQEIELSPPEVLHVRGLGPDGVIGYSPIRYAREAVGLGLATQQHGAKFFGSGARPGGVLVYPGIMGDLERENIRTSWNREFGGTKNSGKTAILEQGLEWKPITIPNEDAQFLETRKFQVLEIARIFRLPPHMLGDRDASTRASVEQEALEFVTHSLRPWLIRWEQEINYKLLNEDENFFAEFTVDALLRADILTRAQVYQLAVQSRWMNPNEVREKENMEPYDGGESFENPNTTGADTSRTGPGDDDGEPDDEEESASNGLAEVRGEAQAIKLQAFERVLRKECKWAENAAKKAKGDKGRFSDDVRAFYLTYETEARENLLNPLILCGRIEGLTTAEATLEAEREIREHLGSSMGQLLAVARDSDDLACGVSEHVKSWVEN